MRASITVLLVGLVGLVDLVGILSCASAPSSSPAHVAPRVVWLEPAVVVDASAPVPHAQPLEPTLTPRRIRGRLSFEAVTLAQGVDPVTAHPVRHAPLLDAGTRGHLVVDGRVGDTPLRVVVDTAAARSVMAPELARKLELLVKGPPSASLLDAVGAEVPAHVVALPPLDVAGARFVNLKVLVPARAIRPDLFLLGVDALAHVDTLIDGQRGALAFVPAGTGEAGANVDADVVTLTREGDGRFVVQGAARGEDGPVAFEMLLDTGAPLSSVPVLAGLKVGIPADVSRHATMRGATGEGVERRGRYLLDPLSVGMVQVGRVAALETPEPRGVLGVDVLSRAFVVLSPARSALILYPVAVQAGDRQLDGQQAIRLAPGEGNDLVLSVAEPVLDAAGGGIRLFVRVHHATTHAPLGGVLEVTVVKAGTSTIETGLGFGAGDISYVVVPRDEAECADVCLRVFGDWGGGSL